MAASEWCTSSAVLQCHSPGTQKQDRIPEQLSVIPSFKIFIRVINRPWNWEYFDKLSCYMSIFCIGSGVPRALKNLSIFIKYRHVSSMEQKHQLGRKGFSSTIMHGCYNQWDVTKSMISTLFTQQTVSIVSIPAHRNIYTTIQCQYPQMMWSSLDISTVNPRYLRKYSLAIIYQFFFPPTFYWNWELERSI